MKISHKLWLIVGVMLVFLSLLAVSAHISPEHASEVEAELGKKPERLLLMSSIGDDVQDIILAAMDMIVDKDSLEKKEQRLHEINESHEDIKKETAQLISATDAADPFLARYNENQGKISKLHALATTQLSSAIDSKADSQEFARLDDAIDNLGLEISKVYSEARDQGLKEFHELEAASHAQNEQSKMIVWATYALSILCSLAIVWFIIRSITKPLTRLSDEIQAIAEGDASIKINALGRKDEIGGIAESLENLRIQVVGAFRLKQMVDDMPLNIITADARDNMKINYVNKSAYNMLANVRSHFTVNVENLIGVSVDFLHGSSSAQNRAPLTDPNLLPSQEQIKLGDETIDLKIAAIRNPKGEYIGPMLSWAVVTQNVQLANTFEQSIGAVSEQISTSATSLNQGAVTLQAAIEELSATATDISRRVHESMQIVRDATDKSTEAQGSMQQLSQSADKVSGVVALIQKIAEKINLLALNATIESARAGEAGKGFAVVANEVKNLASQTANAITEISMQVSEMHGSAEQAVQMVQSISKTIQSINQFASDVATAVEQQQASTSEIAKNICGSDARSGACERNSVLGLASQLTSVSSELKKECTTFLEKVRKI